VAFLGYVEVASGLCCGCIAAWMLIAYKFTLLNIVVLILALFLFISGYLLLRNLRIGVYLSLIAQATTVMNITTPDFSFFFGNLLNFAVSLRFDESTMKINIVSLAFLTILLLNIKRKPNNAMHADGQGAG
jgi:hypothetical protein